MILYYTNSFFASVVSILGCTLAACGIGVIIEPEDMGVGVGIVLILLGLALIVQGKRISENKKFKKWWKQIEDNHLEPEIAKSAELAVTIYNKNPQKRTLEAIRKLNPAAAAQIEKSIAK